LGGLRGILKDKIQTIFKKGWKTSKNAEELTVRRDKKGNACRLRKQRPKAQSTKYNTAYVVSV
jgi:hypothetical protein